LYWFYIIAKTIFYITSSNNTNLLSYNSGGLESETGLTGLKVKMSAGLDSYGGIRGELISLSFPPSRNCAYSFAHGLFPSFIFFLKILFIYLTGRDTVREGTQAGGVGEGEGGFPLSREPDAGLDPRTLGSRPEPKVDA